MPYITQENRDDLYDRENCAENGGELNYLISQLCAEYIYTHGLRYSNISDVVGALEGAKQEFFRQVVNPYEELKILENGGLPAYHWAEYEIREKREKAVEDAIDEALEGNELAITN